MEQVERIPRLSLAGVAEAGPVELEAQVLPLVELVDYQRLPRMV